MKWFKHDCDANRDPKLEKVLMRYGAEGYALYWLCIELIAAPIDKHNLTFELEHDAEILAHRLKIDSATVEEIMKFMVNLELFELDPATQAVTCLKLAQRLENSIVKSPELAQAKRTLSGGGYIYFVSASGSGSIKIGFSKNPWSRLKELQGGSPEQLELRAKLRVDALSEKELHGVFADFRINGEWFKSEPPIIQLIQSVNEGLVNDYDQLLRRATELRSNYGEIVVRTEVEVEVEVETDIDTEKKSTTAASRPTADPPEFAELKTIYPKRSGAQPWPRARKAINARLKAGATWQQILDGARRYSAFCEVTGKVGTEYVMQAATFCGPEKHFLEPWHPPPNKAEVRQGKNVAAGLEFLEKGDES